MRYYKIVSGGYLVVVGTNIGGEEITTEEYQTTLDIIRSRPTPPAGFDYRLKTDLTWEQYELPAADPDPDLTAEEALEILTGGAADA